MAVAPFNLNGTVYVPLRFILAATGFKLFDRMVGDDNVIIRA